MSGREASEAEILRIEAKMKPLDVLLDEIREKHDQQEREWREQMERDARRIRRHAARAKVQRAFSRFLLVAMVVWLFVTAWLDPPKLIDTIIAAISVLAAIFLVGAAGYSLGHSVGYRRGLRDEARRAGSHEA